MKKLLIASTALVATAGMASADITISGHAAAGIHSALDDNNNTAQQTLQPTAYTAMLVLNLHYQALQTTVYHSVHQ